MKITIIGLSLALAGMACGQLSDQQRLAVIEDARDARVSNQSDYWFDKGDFPAIIQALRYRLGLNPGDYETLTDLAWMFKNIERPDLELALVVQFRRDNPDSADAAYPEAEFYFNKRSYVQTIDLLSRVIDMTPPPQANAFRILAHSYSRIGFLKESLAVWDKYIALVPGDAAAKVNRQRVVDRIAAQKGKNPPPRT